MATPQISGNLPWDNAGARMLQGVDWSNPDAAMKALGDNYANSYNNALAMNQRNYENILQGYQSTAGALAADQMETRIDYENLMTNVDNRIASLGGAERQRLNDLYAAQSGQQAQSLIDRGLGNTTVQNAVQRGLTLDHAKAGVGLNESIAGMQAQYMADLGLERLGFRERSLERDANLATGQLDWQNSVDAAYPDAQAYGSLASQLGATGQANRDRLTMQDAVNRQMLAAQQPQSGRGGGAMMVGGGATPTQSVSYGGGRRPLPAAASGGGSSAPPLVGAGGGTGPGTYAQQVGDAYAAASRPQVSYASGLGANPFTPSAAAAPAAAIVGGMYGQGTGGSMRDVFPDY